KISQPQRVSNQLMHIVDWLPTLYGLAGGSLDSLGDIDGIDMWESLSENKESRRTLVLHNIDDTDGTAALRKDQWKIV
ncbi:hypothetical protein NL478_28050, partial [Klebsiella pneumoniae]|nr:hypothetical protein [Klebsiella pneumoniae]